MSGNKITQSFQVTDDSEELTNNPSANLHLTDVLQSRMSRRQFFKGGLGIATLSAFGGSAVLSACGGNFIAPDNETRRMTLGFTAVAKNLNDLVTVPAGYDISILHALGDPMGFGDAAWANDGSESADSYTRRIGDGHDGMHYFGLSDSGKYAANRSDRGLLCCNHEYVVEPFGIHPAGATLVAGARPAEEVDKEVNAHGVSIVEVRRSNGSSMEMVLGSNYNRRITASTEMDITGPASGSVMMQTKYSPAGVKTRGTNNNCGNGYTPWGTYLTTEENYIFVWSRNVGDDAKRSASEVAGLNRYSLKDGAKSRYGWETPAGGDLYQRWNASVSGATAQDDYRNAPNTYGWILEIDPFDLTASPKKRTALGRFFHEGCWPANPRPGHPLVWYMGDDSRNEYIYKFVSDALWDPADVGGGYAAGDKYMDAGKLYVAKFNDDGSGQWLELGFGKNGLDNTNASYAFADQADVLINTRLAADALGATKMDRPEWGAVHPQNHEVYFTLTNNSNRLPVGTAPVPNGRSLVDAANPRSYTDDKAGKAQTGNVNGHIIRWLETNADAAQTTFQWDIFLFGAQADAAANINLSGLGDSNDFSSPDGLSFDSRGLLWIQTDDGAFTDVSNCMLLAALPGKVGDGQKVTAAGGGNTIRGQLATDSNLRRFLVGPSECEITGLAITPDHKTLLINIQHPGEQSQPNWIANTNFSSNWPASQNGAAATSRPRSATVVISKKDGGEIAL